jgi:predicted MFS family arabinose efflux permease
MSIWSKLKELFYGPNYKWFVIGLLFFASLLNLEDRVVIFSVLPLIKKELHLSDVHLGALMSVFLWVYALCSPFAGYFGDRLSRRKVVIGCLFLWSLVTIAAGFATSPGILMVTRVLLGLSQAFYVPASMAILADYHTAATRGKAVAILITGMSLGPLLGGAAAGWVGDHYGWRPTLIILGAAGIGLAILLFALLREVAVGESEESATRLPEAAGFWTTIKGLLSIRSYLTLIFAVAVFSLAAWMLITWLPIFLYDSFGMNLMQSGFFGNLALTGPLLVGSMLGGVLSDCVASGKPKRRMILMFSFYALALPWPILFRSAGGAFFVLASAFIFQLCRALGELNCYPLMYDLVSPERRSTALGISNSANSIFGGLGALIVGYYKQSLGFQAVFGMVPILIALAVGGLLMSYRLFLNKDLSRAARPEEQPEEELNRTVKLKSLLGHGE